MKTTFFIVFLSAGLVGFAMAQDVVPDGFAPPEELPEDPAFKPKEKTILKAATATSAKAAKAAAAAKQAAPAKPATNAPAAAPKAAPAAQAPAAPAPAAQAAPEPAAAPAPAVAPAADAAPAAPPPVNLPPLEQLPILKSRQFFAINLGENIAGVLDRAKAANVEVKETGIRYNADLHQYTEHTITGSLDGNKKIQSVEVKGYEGRVCGIKAYFNDLTDRYMEGIVKGLNEKYGAPPEAAADAGAPALEKNLDYEAMMDGQKVRIQFTVFRNPETQVVLKILLKYDYALMMDIHDAKVREVRDRRPNEGF